MWWPGQPGHHKSNAQNLRDDFIVEGEQHILGAPGLRQGFGVAGVAIDRFTGWVIDKQIDVVNE